MDQGRPVTQGGDAAAHADECLYRSKEAGRNRTTAVQIPSPSIRAARSGDLAVKGERDRNLIRLAQLRVDRLQALLHLLHQAADLAQ